MIGPLNQQLDELRAAREQLVRAALRDLLDLVRDDAHAMSFQSLAQYRKVLIGEIGRKIRGLEQPGDG